MKVPFPPNKLITQTPNTTRTTTSTSPFEPKSVLDLRASPSPKAQHKPNPDINDFQPDDHALINQIDDWDSLMRELGLHDDSNSNTNTNTITNTNTNTTPVVSKPILIQLSPEYDFPSFEDSTQFVVESDFGLLSDIPNYAGPSQLLPANNEFDFVDELIRLGESFETKSLQLSHAILSRLNSTLKSPTGKPLQRAAFYFKEAMQTLLTGSTRPTQASSAEIVQTIKAQKTFSSVSPVPMFASFTANQAVLEAMDGLMPVHVIDFDIGMGGHWASFMKEMAEKADLAKTGRPMLRITALVDEEYAMESRLVRENLTQFARELSIRFDMEFVVIRTFRYLSFKAVKFLEGERVAVLLSPSIFRHVGTGFLNDLRRISPHVVVHVDVEGQVGFGTSSYRQAVIDGLEFYSTLLESLEAVNFNGGGGEWMRRIEMFVLFPKILEGVEAVAGRQGAVVSCREAMVASGMRQVGLSQFADFQAECLLRRVQARGFHVVKRQAEMLLCWHDRPLVATSAWRY